MKTIVRKRTPRLVKPIVVLFCVGFLLALVAQQHIKYHPEEWDLIFPDHTVGLAPYEIDLHKWEVIDLRTEEEYAVSHLPGSYRFSYERIIQGDFPEIHSSKPLLIYCTIGWRSQKAGLILQEAVGHPVFHIEGGLFGWLASGRTLENPKGTQTIELHPYSPIWELFQGYGTPTYHSSATGPK